MVADCFSGQGRNAVLHFGKYERPSSVQEALELLRKGRNNRILGGGVWLRLQDRKIPTAIDLSACGLDRIERVDFATGEAVEDGDGDGDAWSIGAMVTLHQLEEHAAFNASTCGVVNLSVRDIVGVQMRNVATVGGSVFGRFGFSDVLCALLPLDCEVELAGAGRMPLARFAAAKTYERDVLVRVLVRDHADLRAGFECLRRSATDFSVLNVCAACWNGAWRVAVGARPARALLVEGDGLGLPEEFTEDELAAACERLASLPFGSNMRGSAAYRRHLARELGKRAIREAERSSVGGAQARLAAQASPAIESDTGGALGCSSSGEAARRAASAKGGEA